MLFGGFITDFVRRGIMMFRTATISQSAAKMRIQSNLTISTSTLN